MKNKIFQKGKVDLSKEFHDQELELEYKLSHILDKQKKKIVASRRIQEALFLINIFFIVVNIILLSI